VFLISSNYIKYNKCFWWDVLYRKGKKRGYSDEAILREEKKIIVHITGPKKRQKM